MVRFRNLGRDINANPLQLRVWITDGYLGTNENYTGPRSGINPLVDISSHAIVDDDLIVDFNYIKPFNWSKTYEVLPETMEHSSLAVIDGYIYLFGGRGSNKILKASTSDPARFIDTESTIPENLYSSHCAVIDGYVYLFGGYIDVPVKNIYSAPVSNPLNWTDHGELLPTELSHGSLIVYDDKIYIFGGKDYNSAVDTIFVADVSNPLSWSDTGNTLEEPLYSSQVTVINNFFYLLGGKGLDNKPVSNIYRANASTLSFSTLSHLPYQVSDGQIFYVGNDLYYITPTAHVPDGYGYQYTSQTRILYSSKINPSLWQDSGFVIPAEVSGSQLAIIYDRVFLYGGSGSSAIFASDPDYIFNYSASKVQLYGEVTRTLYSATTTESEQFVVLGIPPWKTNY